MITYRRAIVLALAVVTLIVLLHSSHSEDRKPYSRADQLPKPKTFNTVVQKKEQAHQDQANREARLSKAYDPLPPPPRKHRAQISLDDLRSRPLRQQLEYQFPYDVDTKFPAYIWQTWKYTPASGKFTKELREQEATWSVLHPSFVHEVITDSVAVHLIRHLYASIPEVVEAYNALPLPVMKADFFRYLILLARGGIYSDIDTSALKSAIEWVPSDVPRNSYGMVIGIEADPDREDWADWYSRRIQFCQWTIQSKAGHPILRNIVANITEETLKRKRDGELPEDSHSIVEFTGPALWTDTVFDYFNSPEYFDLSTSKANITWRQFTGIKSARKVGDVVVLPITSFSPGVKQMGAGEDDDPMAFVKHLFEGSWKPESERHIDEKEKARKEMEEMEKKQQERQK